MSKGKDVVEFRKRIKIALVKAFGGACQRCGTIYPEYMYDFHHLNPADKSFGLGNASTTRAKSAYAEEAKKCVMVCSNCHRFIEYEGADLELSCSFDEEKYYETLQALVQPVKIEEPKEKKVSRKPDREVLKADIRSMPMVAVGRKYEVSDNAIRKWCISYNLPSKVTEIKSYTDEEWLKI